MTREINPHEFNGMRDILSWDSLHRLRKINNHLSSVASGIDDLEPSFIDIAVISERLQAFSGISIWKLRAICDFMHRLEGFERQRAQRFERYLQAKISRDEILSIVSDFQI